MKALHLAILVIALASFALAAEGEAKDGVTYSNDPDDQGFQPTDSNDKSGFESGVNDTPIDTFQDGTANHETFGAGGDEPKTFVDEAGVEKTTHVVEEPSHKGHRMCFNLVQAGDDGVVLKQFKCDPENDSPEKYPLKDAKKWEDDKINNPKRDEDMSDDERRELAKHFCNFGQFATTYTAPAIAKDADGFERIDSREQMKSRYFFRDGFCIAEYKMSEYQYYWDDAATDMPATGAVPASAVGPREPTRKVRNPQWDESKFHNNEGRDFLQQICGPQNDDDGGMYAHKYTVFWKEEHGQPHFVHEGRNYPAQGTRKFTCVRQAKGFESIFDKVDCNEGIHDRPESWRDSWIKRIVHFDDKEPEKSKVTCNRLKRRPNPHDNHSWEDKECENRFGELKHEGHHGSPERCERFWDSAEDKQWCDFRRRSPDGTLTHDMDPQRMGWRYHADKDDEGKPFHLCFKENGSYDEERQCHYAPRDDPVAPVVAAHATGAVPPEKPMFSFLMKKKKDNMTGCWRPAKARADKGWDPYGGCPENYFRRGEREDNFGARRPICIKPVSPTEECGEGQHRDGPYVKPHAERHCGGGETLDDLYCRGGGEMLYEDPAQGRDYEWRKRTMCQNLIEKYDKRQGECEQYGEMNDGQWKFKPEMDPTTGAAKPVKAVPSQQEWQQWFDDPARRMADEQARREKRDKEYESEAPPLCALEGQNDEDRNANCWKIGTAISGTDPKTIAELEKYKARMTFTRTGDDDKGDWCSMPAVGRKNWVEPQPAKPAQGTMPATEAKPGHWELDKNPCPYVGSMGEAKIFVTESDDKDAEARCIWEANPEWRDPTGAAVGGEPGK